MRERERERELSSLIRISSEELVYNKSFVRFQKIAMNAKGGGRSIVNLLQIFGWKDGNLDLKEK
jgi:hypothetical protein